MWQAFHNFHAAYTNVAKQQQKKHQLFLLCVQISYDGTIFYLLSCLCVCVKFLWLRRVSNYRHALTHCMRIEEKSLIVYSRIEFFYFHSSYSLNSWSNRLDWSDHIVQIISIDRYSVFIWHTLSYSFWLRMCVLYANMFPFFSILWRNTLYLAHALRHIPFTSQFEYKWNHNSAPRLVPRTQTQ